MRIRALMARARSADAFIVSVTSAQRPWLAVVDGGPLGIGEFPLTLSWNRRSPVRQVMLLLSTL